MAIFCEAVPEAKESESLSLAKQNVSLAVLQTLEITIWHPLMAEWIIFYWGNKWMNYCLNKSANKWMKREGGKTCKKVNKQRNINSTLLISKDDCKMLSLLCVHRQSSVTQAILKGQYRNLNCR